MGDFFKQTVPIRVQEYFTHNSLYPPCSLLRYQYGNHKSLATVIYVVVNEELREKMGDFLKFM